MFQKLRHRSYTMSRLVAHVEGSPHRVIIETGTAYIKDCWSGHGQSTLVWDWLIRESRKRDRFLAAVSIDLNPEGIKAAAEQTEFVSYRCGDSVKILAEIEPDLLSQCALLYLDSFDWQPHCAVESSFHHLAELAAVWRLLPSGCMIAVDDRHSSTAGKHLFVAQFMVQLGIKPAFAESQIGWVKP